jgi:hypothetical protein
MISDVLISKNDDIYNAVVLPGNMFKLKLSKFWESNFASSRKDRLLRRFQQKFDCLNLTLHYNDHLCMNNFPHWSKTETFCFELGSREERTDSHWRLEQESQRSTSKKRFLPSRQIQNRRGLAKIWRPYPHFQTKQATNWAQRRQRLILSVTNRPTRADWIGRRVTVVTDVTPVF